MERADFPYMPFLFPNYGCKLHDYGVYPLFYRKAAGKYLIEMIRKSQGNSLAIIRKWY